MAYPATKDSYTAVDGTTVEATADHAAMHNMAGSAVVNIETTLGTTGGTSVLKSFTAGDMAARINTSNVLQQRVSGTVDNAILGTPAISAGTISNMQLIGTSQITGGTITNAALIGTSQITGGTISAVTLGTPVMDHFTSSDTSTPSQADRALAPTVGTLTDTVGTIAINAALAQVFELTLGTAGGNRTFAAPSNATDGQSLSIRAKQNAGNTGTLVFNAVFRMSSDVGTPTLGTESTWCYTAWRYNDTDTKWDFQGVSKNII